MPDPTGDTEKIYSCVPGCGALVVDQAMHAEVCPAKTAIRDDAGPGLGEQICAWLDELDTDELERASIENSGFDTNVTTAVITELRRRAAEL